MKKIASREGLGDVLAEGTYRAALRLGKLKKRDLSPYVVHSKGISIGAHGIRSGKDFPESVSYAIGVQGGDHTSLSGLPLERNSELLEVFNDSGVFCNFNSFSGPRNIRFDFYNAVTGLRLTRKEWCRKKGLKILMLQRAMLLLGGPDVFWDGRDDVNPVRFYEPLPSGPYKGKVADRAEVERYKRRYYRAVGWDENGVPTYEVLEDLGLKDVDRALEKVRRKQ
jgi:aldehyde:ferredoxin oxidoreductase